MQWLQWWLRLQQLQCPTVAVQPAVQGSLLQPPAPAHAAAAARWALEPPFQHCPLLRCWPKGSQALAASAPDPRSPAQQETTVAEWAQHWTTHHQSAATTRSHRCPATTGCSASAPASAQLRRAPSPNCLCCCCCAPWPVQQGLGPLPLLQPAWLRSSTTHDNNKFGSCMKTHKTVKPNQAALSCHCPMQVRSASVHQCLSASMPQCLTVPVLQCLSASASTPVTQCQRQRQCIKPMSQHCQQLCPSNNFVAGRLARCHI